MNITKNTTTRDLNESFTSAFPFLKLSFYKKPHDHFRGSEVQDEVLEVVTFGTLNPDMTEGTIEWDGEMSVDNLETYLESAFGLHAQVFRKSGDIWLQTTVTDHWTLDEQNKNAANNENFSIK